MISQIAVALLALLAVSWAGAEDVRDVPPADCMPGLRDHSFMWWAYGWRNRSPGGAMAPQGQQIRCVQTGHYGLAMDVEKAAILHFGPFAKASSYEEEVSQGNDAVFALPPADLGLTIRVGGKTYRCTGTSSRELGVPSPGRLIESGRFVQRADIKYLRFADEGGEVLPCRARLETVAWPDTLVLRLEASPAAYNLPLKAGPAPGRVGGGYAFDGKNYLEFPDAPGLEPENLTAELWVYVPEGALAHDGDAWILCKDGSEWDLGNYGFHLAQDRIDVSLNCGGGRENCLWLSAEERLREDRWTHLAMTYDGATLRLYVDGKLSASKDVNKRRAPGSRPLALGRRQDNDGTGYHFTGIVDEVRVYGRALSDQEIAAHAAEPEKIGPDPALAAHWSFDVANEQQTTAPASDWKGASLAIDLAYAGRHYAARIDAAADEVWKIGEPHRVVLALKPAEPEAKAEPPVEAAGLEVVEVVRRQGSRRDLGSALRTLHYRRAEAHSVAAGQRLHGPDRSAIEQPDRPRARRAALLQAGPGGRGGGDVAYASRQRGQPYGDTGPTLQGLAPAAVRRAVQRLLVPRPDDASPPCPVPHAGGVRPRAGKMGWTAGGGPRPALPPRLGHGPALGSGRPRVLGREHLLRDGRLPARVHDR